MNTLIDKIFKINNAEQFQELAMEVFRFQYENNSVYHQYCKWLKKGPENTHSTEQVPFLPVQFFKSHEIVSVPGPYHKVYTSSGTTGNITSRHFVKDVDLYLESCRKGFELFYGDIEKYCVLALLPSYLEREGSSLVEMAQYFIGLSKNNNSGFFLNNINELVEVLKKNESTQQKTLLLGVTFALLDFVEKHTMSLDHTVVMETGGMKGRRKEMTRQEAHAFLTSKLGIKKVHSEYGMTELLSQAYSSGNGLFQCPPWMKIMIRDQYDPFSPMPHGNAGGINIIDLANINSCAFIETMDLGRTYPEGNFEILGRFDNSDIRGCNLMIQ